MFGAGIGVVLLGAIPQIPWPVWIVILVVFGASEWFVWRVIKPPFLRADAMEISCVAPLGRQQMPRSDLASIFRGQVSRQGRYGSYWDKSYIFATADGKLGMSCSASGFTGGGIAEFAQRLQVPLRGDFSVQAKDRVDPTLS
jgi:hypothetical protein